MIDLKHKILSAVEKDLEAIEAALAENLKPHFDLVRRVAGHLLFAGGKRLRPLLMMLCARACGYGGGDLQRYAIIFEYLHAATLLHDDVVDGGQLRRGSNVAHQVWDPPTAVLTGDFLLARSLSLAADTDMAAVIHAIAAITEQMSQGEIQQLHRKGDLKLSEDDYLEIIRCKTAVLFEGACRVGALVARASEETVEAMSSFGHHLGMAFQMIDDLLDYTQDAEVLGKQAGADLREGKLTLPVIYALARADGRQRQMIAGLVGEQPFSPQGFAALVDMMGQCGAIDDTRQRAVDSIHCAKQALVAVLAPSTERALLIDIADYALVRNF